MNAITTQQPRTMQTILVPTTFDQLVTFADMAATSGMVPKDYNNKPGAIMIAVQMGSELGLSPMQSINSIAVINGRPGVWGDGLIGLCRQSPLCQDIVETISGEGDAREAVCVATRRGSTPVTGRFSVADAKRAGLFGKNIWAAYPDRMLTNRARGFALRDAFPDVLRGLKTAEELMDTPADTFRGTTIDQTPAAAKPHTEVYSRREEINKEVAAATPAKRTGKMWLDELAAKIAACTTKAELVEFTGSPEMLRALNWFKNGAKIELDALLADAMERVKALDDDAAEAEIALPDEGGNSAEDPPF